MKSPATARFLGSSTWSLAATPLVAERFFQNGHGGLLASAKTPALALR
jgi:hypothetical protein